MSSSLHLLRLDLRLFDETLRFFACLGNDVFGFGLGIVDLTSDVCEFGLGRCNGSVRFGLSFRNLGFGLSLGGFGFGFDFCGRLLCGKTSALIERSSFVLYGLGFALGPGASGLCVLLGFDAGRLGVRVDLGSNVVGVFFGPATSGAGVLVGFEADPAGMIVGVATG